MTESSHTLQMENSTVEFLYAIIAVGFK